MGKISATILGAVIGGLSAVIGMVFLFGWGFPSEGQQSYLDPTRSDYVDLLLTLVTIFLGGIGLAVTVGAIVIGMVALKTLREIKDEAAEAAKKAAANKIADMMATELTPSVRSNVEEILPSALRAALLDDDTGHKILTDMAQAGVLDEVLERVVVRIQTGGAEIDLDEVIEEGDQT